jgi:hypothetical protein
MNRRSRAATVAVLGSLVITLAAPMAARAQIAGESVNMVSGIQWPGGDPFLQRQNEPSIAVSSANPMHLLAGANDYRSVDIASPFKAGEQQKMAGDAWQGVFKSYDGGQTWRSYLMPGYPQDLSTEGASSAVRGPSGEVLYNAAADSVVRAGTDGMFYFAGIVFKRGTGDGRVVLNRFIDLNNKEDGSPVGGTDSIRWIDAKVIDQGGTGTYFADKPWIAVDVPRPGTTTCNIQKFGRTVAGGAIYVVWARIYSDTQSDIMFSRSLDCGDTWSAPLKLNDQKALASQGASISVDPRTGYVYAAWRRFGLVGASPKQDEDAIFAVRSFSMGQKFTHPRLVTTFIPFEQGQGPYRFRTEVFPTIVSAMDAKGTRSWTHVAWSQRAAPGADGQIVMTHVVVSAPPKSFDEWNDPLDGWTIPPDPVDATAVLDAPNGNAFTRGHQFMPALTFSQGKLVLVYYDSRLDHTRTYYAPHQNQDPCAPVGTCWIPNDQGRWYDEERGPIGDRTGLDWTTDTLDDLYMTQTRHTIDVRMATADATANPVFTSATLSRMPFGERGDELELYGATGQAPGFDVPITIVDGTTSSAPSLRRLQDLQVNPPNLPMFKNGTTPFIGDYIDVQGPMFVRTPTGWAFNTAPTAAPVFHAVWTSNQDVVPPAVVNGVRDWTRYTPPARAAGTTSVYDPGQSLATGCDPGFTGTRNQNVYTARISGGLVVTSPQNAKKLGASGARTFVVSAFNATNDDRMFRFSFGSQTAGVGASFRPFEAKASVDVKIPAHSAAVQTVFLRVLAGVDPATVNPATTVVNVDEVTAGVSSPLGGFVTLNPPGPVFDMAPLDNGSSSDSLEALDVQLSAASLYYANLSNAHLSNANLSNANLSNANLSNANLSNANLSNANLSNNDPASFTLEAAHLSNANLSNSDLSSANLSNANLSNANLSNANLSNANLSNANLSNAALADVDYTVTNTGNTTQGFDVGLFSTVGSGLAPVQIIVSRPYGKPIANGCAIQEQPDNQLVVNAGVFKPAEVQGSPDPLATFAIAPGESVRVTLRTYLTPVEARNLATLLAPRVVPQGNPNGATTGLIVTSPGSNETAKVGTRKTVVLTASGGTGTLTWSVAPGSSLPPGFDAAALAQGKLDGVPTQVGSFPFTLKVVDTATPLPNQMFKDVTLVVEKGSTTATLVPSWTPSTTSPVYGQAVTLTATISPSPGSGEAVTFLDGASSLGASTLSGGTATLALPATLSVGAHSFSVGFAGNASYAGSTSAAAPVNVSPADTGVTLTSGGVTVYGGEATLTAVVQAKAPGSGTPSGQVEFREGTKVLQTVTLNAGVAVFKTTALSGGLHTVTAGYLGDGNFKASVGTGVDQSVGKVSTSLNVTLDPASLVYGVPVPITVTAGTVAGAASPPTGSVDFWDGATFLGSDPFSGGSATHLATGLAAGLHDLGASYVGDVNYAALARVSAPVSIARAGVTVTVTSQKSPSTFGETVVYKAQVTSGTLLPVGTVTFYRDVSTFLGSATIDGTGFATLSSAEVPGGTHPISAYFEGSANFAAAPSQISWNQVVNTVSSAAVLGASPNPSGPGEPVVLSCTVTSAAGSPTGTVGFKDGATLVGQATAPVSSGAGVAVWSLATTALAGGVHSLTCEYSGNGSIDPSKSAAVTQLVGPIATQTTLNASTTSTSYGQSVTLKAVVAAVPSTGGTPTGTVSFLDTTASGTVTLGSAPLSAGSATLPISSLPAGTHSITARYDGTTLFSTSTSSPAISLTVVFKFTGYLSPLKTTGTLDAPTYSGAQNFGSAVPVKWTLQDASGAYLGDLATTTSLVAYPYTSKLCGPAAVVSGPVVLYKPTQGATGGSTFRFGSNTFIFNWDTSKGAAKGCFNVVLTLSDGTVKASAIKLQ